MSTIRGRPGHESVLVYLDESAEESNRTDTEGESNPYSGGFLNFESDSESTPRTSKHGMVQDERARDTSDEDFLKPTVYTRHKHNSHKAQHAVRLSAVGAGTIVTKERSRRKNPHGEVGLGLRHFDQHIDASWD